MVAVPEGVTLVVGLGVSGRAICRHLAREGRPFMVADTRAEPPGLAEFKARYPDVVVHCGPLTALDLEKVEQVVLSPGIDPQTPGLEGLAGRQHRHTGEPLLVGEMALFRRATNVPVAAITGSNAKSTVTSLLGEMAKASGIVAAVGGNLGTAALDLLEDVPDAELFILELSSFQLETTPCLAADVACFLNLSEDHLDRHGDMAGYRAAKLRIFDGARTAVVNADDAATWPDAPLTDVVRFTQQAPALGEWGLGEIEGALWLARGDASGVDGWLAVDELMMSGRHNQLNALAALAMGERLGFEREAMCQVLRRFTGLAHRSEPIAERDGVRWINDSKGTNVGATLAAITGVTASLKGKLILLAGGVGKGADFTPLAAPLARHARCALLFGQDAERLAQALAPEVAVEIVATLEQALARAMVLAKPGDGVLLSPACASLDQFANYQARGEAFRRWVTTNVASNTSTEAS